MWQQNHHHSASSRPSGFKAAAAFRPRARSAGRRRGGSAAAAVRTRPASASADSRGRRLLVEREKMLHNTRITEKHSTAAILSNQPRWGLSMDERERVTVGNMLEECARP